MDYESCFERIWRAGLLRKAAANGINGRLWMYLRSYLNDRHYYIKVNNMKSETMTSTVGIPQGSVLSPTLCNLYTSDSMEAVTGRHTEYADDAGLWNSDHSVETAVLKTNLDLEKITRWCDQWNMRIAPEKTEVLVFGKNRDNLDQTNTHIFLKNKEITVSKSKKVLGIIIDDNLKFEQHIKEKTAAGFGALKSIDMFVTQNSGCTQSTYMKLYKSLVQPVFTYRVAVIPTASSDYNKCFGSIPRSAMVKASGCLSSTSTEALEILINCIPLDLQIKLIQAQEVIRIAEKRETDPLKEEFNNWLSDTNSYKGKPTTFQLLMTIFNELRGTLKLENIEREFEYSREHYGLSRRREHVHTDNFKVDKDMQVDNIREIIDSCDDNTVLAFTDGSALGNPGPTGAGAAVYLEGYSSIPILLNRGVSKNSNNYSGEIVGIEIALEFLADINTITGRKIHIFTDCQAAIMSAFCKEIPTNKIEAISNIKKYLAAIEERQNHTEVHWIPGHKNLTGNELADKQAKLAATEMSMAETEEKGMLDAREAVTAMKSKAVKKWNNKYLLSDKTDTIQEIFSRAGSRNCTGEEDRKKKLFNIKPTAVWSQ
ncbi:uncharacterized protein LOC123561196 [Mercenaria mercenaria]|uniref:uncharacterized protein LOC123561196 n=1 Tax=Mercenaria mercenaria TaxID=6596 RepID=UPI00234E9883|nr:uncharacterized protein LOC123561196 [Mercenaria mercenaria]